MRLSRRQLKRIIREEFSRLRRRRLVRESMIQDEDALYDAREVVEMELSDETILAVAAYGKESEFAYNYVKELDEDMKDEIRDCCVELAYQGFAPKQDGLEQAMVLWELCSGIEQRVRYEMENP